MRTKVLLCAAALAASLASSMAQNVYSLNVVGYVNITIPANSFALVANPLDATSGGTTPGMNNITNLFLSPPDGSTIQTWDQSAFGGLGDFSAAHTYYAPSSGGTGWDTGLDMPPGKGVFIYTGTALPVTFVGQVVQGTYTVAHLTSGAFDILGSPVPIGGNLTNSLMGLVVGDGDTIQLWDQTAFGGLGDWTSAETYYAPSSGGTGWTPGTATIAAGQGFFYSRSGPTTTWVSNFTVQ